MVGSLADKRVWRKVLNYRVIPSSLELSVDQNLAVDLTSTLPSYLALYSEHTDKGQAWNLQNGALVIGNGTQYVEDIHAEASAFINLPAQNLKLNFDASIFSEDGYDFFKVVLVADGKENILLANTSGKHPMQSYSYDLSAYAGKKIEVRFVFDSDAGVNDVGATLQNISLTH